MRFADRPTLLAGLVLLGCALAAVLVPEVAEGAAVVLGWVRAGALWVGAQVLVPIWNFLASLV